MRNVFISSAVLVLSASAAAADEVLLESGGKLEGKVTRDGKTVVVTTPHAEVRVLAGDVKSIRLGRSVFDDYADKVKALDAKSAAAQVALGDWCKERGLGADARKHWNAALAIHPDDAGARARLGFIAYDGRWLTSDEYHRARGFVRVEGEWVPAEEARRRVAERQGRIEQARREKKVRDAVVKMSSMKRKTRAAGKLQLVEYAESIGDLKLADFATRMATYSNDHWRRVREALVTVDVRATLATLKRPIPTITTTLGAFSTPVTIQLPELSVVSVKTTALVPADIELDEE
jgi:hypothetical protein